MDALQQALNAVCPNLGYNSDGRITFTDAATASQVAAAQAVMETYLANPASWLAANSPQPYPTGLGWNMAIDPVSQLQFDKMAGIIATAQNVYGGTDLSNFLASATTMKDDQGGTHTVTFTVAQGLLLGYGVYCAGLWAAGTLPV